ncbi:MAG: hypothetical protein ACM37Z_00995 [Deltaproteobacteria bacterium]
MRPSVKAAVVIAYAMVGTILVPLRAQATDEIQVYNAEIAEVGQWTIQQHLNYTFIGRTQPDFPGGLIPDHSLNGTPELAYGISDWWELGFYAPFAVNSGGQFLSDGAKIRNLFVVPNAGKRDFFYGVNFELSYETPPFAQTRYALEIRPIIGVRNKEWEFIVNPIVDLSFGTLGQQDFAPCLRLARNLGEDRFIGIEYYADLGQIGNFLPLQGQSHQIFAVTDFKLDKFDIELGVGYGLTPGSDRLVAKAIVGYAFPVPGKKEGESGHAPKALMFTKTAMGQTTSNIRSNPFALQ